MKKVSKNTISRLCIYKRVLKEIEQQGAQQVFSHDLAKHAHVTPAQVRRDLMVIGYMGSPARGYGIQALAKSIAEFLSIPQESACALVGIGNLGRALLAYFKGPPQRFCAAFDIDPEKVDRVIHGCRCYHLDMLPSVAGEKGFSVAVIAVPASAAQAIADQLVFAGIRGILNFAPVALRVPANIYVESIDMNVVLEKVAFFAARGHRPA